MLMVGLKSSRKAPKPLHKGGAFRAVPWNVLCLLMDPSADDGASVVRSTSEQRSGRSRDLAEPHRPHSRCLRWGPCWPESDSLPMRSGQTESGRRQDESKAESKSSKHAVFLSDNQVKHLPFVHDVQPSRAPLAVFLGVLFTNAAS